MYKNLTDTLVCALCKGSLERSGAGFTCTKCGSFFPVNKGIASFINDEIIKRERYLKEEISCQDRCLRVYTDVNSLHYYFTLFHLTRLAGFISGGRRVLDLGCGIGKLGDVLKKEIWGIDISKTLLERAKEKERYVFQATGNYLPFADNMFDAVFMRSALHHSDYTDEILNEAFRVLKPYGLLISSDPRRCLLTEIARLLRGSNPHYSPMHRSFNAEEYISIFKKRFTVESAGYSFFIFYLFTRIWDSCRISLLMPFKKTLALLLFKLDLLMSRLFRFTEKYNFMINVIARKPKC